VPALFGEWKLRKEEMIFKICPHCGNDHWNFEVNITSKLYHCWVCDYKGRDGGKFFVGISNEELATKYGIKADLTYNNDSEISSVFDGSDEGNRALRYLRHRGMSDKEIGIYISGYGRSGRYKDYILIPLHTPDDEDGYVVGRSFTGRTPKYLNPEEAKSDKVVGYWTPNDKSVVVICEGAFDAIALKRMIPNVMVMTGKVLTDNMVEFAHKFEKIILWPDNDVPHGQVHKMYEQMASGHNNVMIAHCGDKKDPGEMTTTEIFDIVNGGSMTATISSILIRHK
jgi:DNA primase